jgi:dTDP-4-amino-4,6-dideoxygalactose transaminase
MKIPLLDLKCEYEYMKDDIDAAIRRCLNHQQWILGPEVKDLEDRIAEYIATKHCIGASSGTDALVLSLRALAIKLKCQEYFDKSDKIITTPFTFTATGDAIIRAGATPVFVDIDPETFNIDPAKIKLYLESAIRNRKSAIRGILAVHLYGQSCQMDEIMAIAKEYNLFVLEDVAQAFGGEWMRKKLGSIGDIGAFSFFPSKNLGGFGDGGMVSTKDDELAELLRMLLKHGGKDKYNVDHVGYNARLDTLQASILLAKLKYVDEFNVRRCKVAEMYGKGLNGVKDLGLPYAVDPLHPTGVGQVFHQYTIRVKNGGRDKLQRHLKEKGTATAVYYPFPLHKMRVFGNGSSEISGSLDKAEIASREVLSLPMEPLQTQEETTYIINSIKEFFKKKE